MRNKKYQKTKKNNGVVPECKDTRALYIAVGCGECMECEAQRRRKWITRLAEDIKVHKNGRMVTLTFSNESIRDLAKHKDVEGAEGYWLDNAIATRAVRAFTERWRKEHGKTIRHWLVTELGHQNTENIHLHGIVWAEGTNEEVMAKVERIWKYGWIWKGDMINGKLSNYVNGATVNYCVGYVTKKSLKHKTYKPIVLTSNGIGGEYTKSAKALDNAYKGEKTEEAYRTSTGHKIAMPTYWRNKIYTDEEREQLWLMKLDKQVRYVNGTKIDVSKDQSEYFEAVKQAQKKNKQLGYGKGSKDWKRATYENERRKAIINHRIELANRDNYPDTWRE